MVKASSFELRATRRMQEIQFHRVARRGQSYTEKFLNRYNALLVAILYILSGTSIPNNRIPFEIVLAMEADMAILNFSLAGSVSLKIGTF